MENQPDQHETSHGQEPACAVVQVAEPPALAEADLQALEQLAEDLEERLQERVKLQARLRDRIEDARDHLQDLRENLSVRQAEMESGGAAESAAEEDDAPVVPPTKPPPEPFSPAQIAGYQMPDLGILRPPTDTEMQGMSDEEVAANRRLLQDTLDSFAVDAMVCDSIVGPRITQFRVRPGFGVRVEAISGLERNIALAMAANSVRIQAPIPGENFVGIEIPNRNSSPLSLRGCLESRAWRESPSDIPIVMGVDINGKVVSCDLARAPHALIAGATGSGKSVCISNVILSLLYRFRPDELELVLVDPKIVEFAIYRDLPHLIHPVVTDPKMACQVLKWLVREMEHRYEILSHKNVRNLAGYNAKAKAEGFDKLPYIVLIIDELADLMMTAPAEVETPIARLAQMSRAVGIHTILATQRPSVNVITGVIKANFPTRMAFQVSSQVDSRTILDTKGAEALQGRGDMLFNPPGIGRLQRLQAPYVDDVEIEKVVASLKEQLQPRYRVELRPEDAPGAGEGGGIDGETHAGLDPLIKQALEVIAANGRASTSYLQRKLKIGYNRAASLMEEMESRRYIGPQVGNNPREIYIQPGELNLD